MALDCIEGLLRSELYINNCLRRNFYWYTAALFGEDLLPLCPSLVVLSGDDQSVPSFECFRMLKRLNKDCRGQGQAVGRSGGDLKSMKVLMLEGQGHGGFLGCRETQAMLLQHICELYRECAAPAHIPATSLSQDGTGADAGGCGPCPGLTACRLRATDLSTDGGTDGPDDLGAGEPPVRSGAMFIKWRAPTTRGPQRSGDGASGQIWECENQMGRGAAAKRPPSAGRCDPLKPKACCRALHQTDAVTRLGALF